VRCIGQVGNGAKRLLAIVGGGRVQQYVATRHAGFHFDDFFALHI